MLVYVISEMSVDMCNNLGKKIVFGLKYSLSVKKILTWNKKGFIPKMQFAHMDCIFSNIKRTFGTAAQP